MNRMNWISCNTLVISAAAVILSAGCNDGFTSIDRGPGQSQQAHSESERYIPPESVKQAGAEQAGNINYDDADRCIGTGNPLRPGTDRLAQHLMQHFSGASRYAETVYCRSIRGSSGLSMHATGRAIDLHIPTINGDEADNEVGDPIANYLIRNATELGVQYFIWDRTEWNTEQGYTEDYCRGRCWSSGGKKHPHHDHLHIELTKRAAENGRNFPTPGGQGSGSSNGSGNSGSSGNASTPEGAPTVVSPSDGESVWSDGVTLEVDGVGGAYEYEFEIQNDNGSSWSSYYTYEESSSSKRFWPQISNTAYRWRVRARTSSGWTPYTNWTVFLFGNADDPNYSGGSSSGGSSGTNGGSSNAGSSGTSGDPGTSIGTFWNTYYYLSNEKNYSGGDTTTLYDASCNPIADVPSSYSDSVCIEGSGKLEDGTVVNYATTCSCGRPCPTGGTICYKELDKSQFPWGEGSRANPLEPLRSWAVDNSVVSHGTVVYVPKWDGVEIPEVDGIGGFTHDGCFRADDVGGAINGKHFDFFAGTEGMADALERTFPTRTDFKVYKDSPQCGSNPTNPNGSGSSSGGSSSGSNSSGSNSSGSNTTQPASNAPTGLSPADGKQIWSDDVTIGSDTVMGATAYEFEIDYYSGYQWLDYYTYETTASSKQFWPHLDDSAYRWRVRAKTSSGWTDKSEWQTFLFGSAQRP